MRTTLVLGTRGSALAMAQSRQVARALERLHGAGLRVELRVIRTTGDRVQDRPLPEVGGKGLFTAELEGALRDGSVDLAVHSLKDLPTEQPPGLLTGAVPPREDPRDMLVGAAAIEALPRGARVGTGSLRRRVQLLDLRPDLDVAGIRGNVDTRLRKLREGRFDAVVLACAGLRRLGLSLLDGLAHAPLDPAICVPAAGQGALAVQCRSDDRELIDLLHVLDDAPTRCCVEAERAFLAGVEGGCHVPAAAHAVLEGDRLSLRAVFEPGDGRLRRVRIEGDASEAGRLGREAARRLRSAGVA